MGNDASWGVKSWRSTVSRKEALMWSTAIISQSGRGRSLFEIELRAVGHFVDTGTVDPRTLIPIAPDSPAPSRSGNPEEAFGVGRYLEFVNSNLQCPNRIDKFISEFGNRIS